MRLVLSAARRLGRIDIADVFSLLLVACGDPDNGIVRATHLVYQLAAQAVEFADGDNDLAFEAVIEDTEFEGSFAETAQLTAQGFFCERAFLRSL